MIENDIKRDAEASVIFMSDFTVVFFFLCVRTGGLNLFVIQLPSVVGHWWEQ